MTVYEEMQLEDLQHTLGQLEAHLEIQKRRADEAEAELASYQQDSGDDEDSEDDDEDDSNNDENDQPAATSSQLKSRQTLELINHTRSKNNMRKADDTSGGEEASKQRCMKCGSSKHATQDCPDVSGRRIGKIVSKAASARLNMDAVTKSNAVKISKSTFENALDGLACAVQKKCDWSYARSYDAMLRTPEGAALFEAYNAAMPALVEAVPEDERISKAKPTPRMTVDTDPDNVLHAISKGETLTPGTLESALDSLATAVQKYSGGSWYAAYSEALRSETGGRIYKALDEVRRRSGS